MKAIILCAGDGTRLRPLTNVTPKPLVEFLDRTILEYALDAIPKKVTDVYLVISPSKVQHFDVFLRTHTFPFSVYTSVQDIEKVGTWSALSSAREFIDPDETFLVFNGDDLFTKEDMEVFVTLPTPACGLYKKILESRYRTCDVDTTTATITSFRDQKSEEMGKPALAFTGMYLLSDEFFNFLPVAHRDEFSIPDTLFHYYRAVGSYEVSSWHAINTLEEYQTAKEAIQGSRYDDRFVDEELGKVDS